MLLGCWQSARIASSTTPTTEGVAPGSSSWMGDKQRMARTARMIVEKTIKVHFVENKVAFYLVVSKTITTFASDKRNKYSKPLERGGTL